MALLDGATIFDYCERGSNPAFWAEPLNAVTNGGFILAAFAGIVMIAKRPPSGRSFWSAFFVLNFIAIGVGSFLFHTVPNVNTALADTGPIGIFMLTYLIFALRRLAGASLLATAAAIGAFVGFMAMSFKMQCWDGHMGFWLDVPHGAQAKCLNGSLGYGPALVAMWLIAAWLGLKRHPAALPIFGAALTFAASLTFRSLDQRLCADWVVLGHRMGTHFIWHLLNSLTLFLLLSASIKYSRRRTQEILPPHPRAGPSKFAIS
jgi:hypothetical protein